MRRRSLAGLAAILLLGTMPAADAQEFRGLGRPLGGTPITNWQFHYGLRISADGTTVAGTVGTRGNNNPMRAFVWSRQTGVLGLGLPPDSVPHEWTHGFGLSGNGAVIVGTVGTSEPAVWTIDGIRPLPGDRVMPRAASADGSMIVGDIMVRTSQPGRSGSWTLKGGGRISHPGLWTDGRGWVLLADRPGMATAITPSGSVVVGSVGTGVRTDSAFRWSRESGMTLLGDGIAWAVSANGTTVVGMGKVGTRYQAFRWTKETGMQILSGFPPGLIHGGAHGVSGDGSVVVGDSYSSAGPEAFIWFEKLPKGREKEPKLRRLHDVLTGEFGLDLRGWRLTGAYGISTDGRSIVGVGVNPQGQQDIWVARLPYPSLAPLAPTETEP